VPMIAAWWPQARGRSEQHFGTWLGRLPQEPRLAGIRTLEEASRFLREGYLADVNRQFTVAGAVKGAASVRRLPQVVGRLDARGGPLRTATAKNTEGDYPCGPLEGENPKGRLVKPDRSSVIKTGHLDLSTTHAPEGAGAHLGPEAARGDGSGRTAAFGRSQRYRRHHREPGTAPGFLGSGAVSHYRRSRRPSGCRRRGHLPARAFACPGGAGGGWRQRARAAGEAYAWDGAARDEMIAETQRRGRVLTVTQGPAFSLRLLPDGRTGPQGRTGSSSLGDGPPPLRRAALGTLGVRRCEERRWPLRPAHSLRRHVPGSVRCAAGALGDRGRGHAARH